MSKANKPRSINKQTNKTRGHGNTMKSNIHSLGPQAVTGLFHTTQTRDFNYSWSSRKRPPRKFKKVVKTRAGRLQEWALVSKGPYRETIEGGQQKQNRRSQYPAMWEMSSTQDRPGGGRYFLVIGLWGCAAGWGCIFMTGLTTKGLYFPQSY